MGNNYTNPVGIDAAGRIQSEYNQGQGINPDYAQDITITRTIGRNGVGGKDFNFAAPADLLQQNLDLGFIIPANAKVILASIKCVIALVGIADMNMVLGNVSAGNQFIISGSVNALNETISVGGATPNQNPIATKVFLGATPVTNTWDLATAGEWLVTITYKDYNKL